MLRIFVLLFLLPSVAFADCSDVGCSKEVAACSDSKPRHPVLGKCTYKNLSCENRGDQPVEIQVCTEFGGCGYWKDLPAKASNRVISQIDPVSVNSTGDFKSYSCRDRRDLGNNAASPLRQQDAAVVGQPSEPQGQTAMSSAGSMAESGLSIAGSVANSAIEILGAAANAYASGRSRGTVPSTRPGIQQPPPATRQGPYGSNPCVYC